MTGIARRSKGPVPQIRASAIVAFLIGPFVRGAISAVSTEDA
jgi:hypothetical protein